MTEYLSFADHALAVQRCGWLQARWYEDGGTTVRDFLSYNAVWDVNPFEVGAKRPMTRRDFTSHRERIVRLLDIRRLMPQPFISLSNGETRRILLARALLRKPDKLVLDDPEAGLDPKQRANLREILAALGKRGVLIEKVEDSSKYDGGTREDDSPRTMPHAPERHDNRADRCGAEIVNIANLRIKFGKRTLFDGFGWVVREGERWWLRGENGRGKSTLLSLINGDNPMAYAADIKVFGVARKVGRRLSDVRSRIGMVSPEMQAYLGIGPMELLETALAGGPDLLLLDEPFMNMDGAAKGRAAALICDYLGAKGRAAAILVSHRAGEVPEIFTKVMDLDKI